jgi:hypothetical protein
VIVFKLKKLNIKNLKHILKVFKTNRIASLPENLPKIDFESYKKQLPNPSAIDKLEKGVI